MAEPYHAPSSIGIVPPTVDASADETASDPSEPTVPSSQPAISETLEELARERARRMLERALHSEVDGYLGRRRYDRVDDVFSGCRNGYAREREISIGTWSVEVRPPRIADTPGHIPPFRSSILPRGRNLTYPTQRLFARLYLEGMSSGDFEPAFRELLGDRAPLSSSTILRLKEDWAGREHHLADLPDHRAATPIAGPTGSTSAWSGRWSHRRGSRRWPTSGGHRVRGSRRARRSRCG